MAPSTHLALLKAEYAYTPQTDDEMALEEDMYYYLLDDSDTEWFHVKVHSSSSTPGGHPQSGLVPANYVVPAQPLRLVTALYAYEAQADEELTIQEDEHLELYEEDGEWSLVGRNSQDNSHRGVGYVPTTYIENVEHAQNITHAEEPALPTSADALPHPSVPSAQSSFADVNAPSWSVTDIDHKKKKSKGTLAIDSNFLVFAGESDKLGIQKYSMSTVSISKIEKGKHLILQCGSEERHFQASEKDLDEIVSKIQRFQQHSQSNSTPPSRTKANTSPVALLAPALRPPSAMANPDRPSGTNGRKVSFATPVGKPATALYDFEAQGDDELTVEEGDRLFVLDDTSDDDWWKCAKQSNGQEGVVPASYIELDQGQPSGNQEAAEAAMTAAAAEDARNRRIQEEQDARLAQQLAEQDRSEAQLENARAADRKLTMAREAEQRKNAEAELAARRKKESEARTREAERAMIDPGFSNGPVPPKLTARPDSAMGMGHQDSSGATPAPPRRPDSAPREVRSKPHGLIRTWRDRTGQFKVEAEFRGLKNGKIRLHKLNGVTIEVPLTKMSSEDVIWLEGATGRTLRSREADDIPLANLSLGSNSSTARPPSEPAKRPSAPAKPPIDWFEFFLNAGCDLDDCTRYATNFERDRIEESLLPDLEPSTMRNLGLREGDVIRVRKLIKQKYASTDSKDDLTAQIRRDEELARKLQQQDVAPAPNIFTTGPNGSLKTTRRGRPTPARSGSSTVDAATLTTAKDKLIDVSQPEVPRSSVDAPLVSISPPPGGGFDDDAWQNRPNSTAPSTAPIESFPSRSTSISSVAAPAISSSVQPTKTPEAPKPSLTDEIFQKIMDHSKQSQATTVPSASAPISMPPAMSPQPVNLNPNGPRGPLAPVASNAPLLNPLVPLNSGMNGFIPTRPTTIQSQPTGFAAQAMPMVSTNALHTNPMIMQPTGVGMSNLNAGGLQPLGMSMLQSQPTGILQPQALSMMQSQPTGMIQPQPTAFIQSQPAATFSSHMSGIVPQPTGFNQTGMMPTSFNQGLSPIPPVPSLPNMYANTSQLPASAPAKSFNPSDIFGQMKTGQFAQTSNASPQDASKYDALRPQPTGFAPNGANFTQQFMPNMQMQPQSVGIQPLTAQPTGFAPGGYIVNQPTGIPNSSGFVNQNQSQQWRGY